MTVNAVLEESPTHPCRACGGAIDNRYRFVLCVRCSLTALAHDPAVVAWRDEKRRAAYARLEAAGLVQR